VEFMKLGTRGVSIIFASGDAGVTGGNGDHRDADCQDEEQPGFWASFPASSPWVTAVGGTTSVPEVGWESSGGGFSNLFPRPSYQDTAVGTYFKSKIGFPSANLYNASGRGFPDVAAQAENYSIVEGGQVTGKDGTSAAAPTFAGIIGLANEARIAAGKRGLGFLNPLIYKVLGPGGAFNDITSGSNPGCGTDGFYAAPGWDPVTGFGTPSLEKIVALVLELP